MAYEWAEGFASGFTLFQNQEMGEDFNYASEIGWILAAKYFFCVKYNLKLMQALKNAIIKTFAFPPPRAVAHWGGGEAFLRYVVT